MVIELPSYKALYKNRVFSRVDTISRVIEKDKSPTGEKMILEPETLRFFILPVVFNEPSKAAIIKNIRNKASYIFNIALSIVVDLTQIKLSNLEEAIINLGGLKIKQIMDNDEDVISAIETSIPNLWVDELNRKYIDVRYGFLPESFIGDRMSYGDITDPEWYDEQLSNRLFTSLGYGRRWGITFSNNDGTLPDKCEVYKLLIDKNNTTKTVRVRYGFDLNEAGEVIDVLYAGLNKPDIIAELHDASDQILHDISAHTVIQASRKMPNERNPRFC